MSEASKIELLKDRDFTVIVDRSYSMTAKDTVSGQTRWDAAQEGTVALARKAMEFDPDGLTLYFFASKHKRFDNVTPEQVKDKFREWEPGGNTALGACLTDAFDNYFERKAKGEGKKGEVFLVITDGEPNSRSDVIEAIVGASKKVDSADEIGVSFIQVGKDTGAKEFLKTLDDDLNAAKFDIVDTISMDDMEDQPLSETLLKALTD